MSVNSKKKFIFTWEIDNFMLCLLNDEKALESPVFVDNVFKMSWFIDIIRKHGENYISCYLNRIQCLQKDVNIRFSLTLISSHDEALQPIHPEPRMFSENNPIWGYEKFHNIDKIENATGSIIIRCIMILDELAGEDSRCKGRTKCAVEKSYFQWNIEEICHPSWNVSKIFPCSSTAHMEIVLTASEDDDFVNISIKKVCKGNPGTHYVLCKLSLLDLKEVQQDSGRSEHVFKSENDTDTWQFPNFLLKSKLKAEKSKYLKNGTFTLMCMFSISNRDSIEYIEEYNNNELVSVHSGTEEDTIIVLQKDLKRMFSNHLQTDVNLRTENRTFQVHKSILSARSPVFAAMFEQDMLENKTGVVDIPDVDALILQSFLEFLYTGTLDNLFYESASKLLILADRYQVSSLKKKCSSFLMLNLSSTNVCDVVLVANMIGEKALKAYAMDYIAAHANIIFISEGWSRCIQNDINLATDILNNLSINVGVKK